MVRTLHFLLGLFLSSTLFGSPNVPLKMKTGRSLLIQTPREKFADVMAELRRLSPEAGTARAAVGMQQRLAAIGAQVPSWVQTYIPRSILLYTDITTAAALMERVERFAQMAMLLRDMYLDLPINREALLTSQIPAELRYGDELRHLLVGMLFREAFLVMEGAVITEGAASQDVALDTYWSLAQYAHWAAHHLALGGPAGQAAATRLELLVLEYTRRAEGALADDTDFIQTVQLPRASLFSSIRDFVRARIVHLRTSALASILPQLMALMLLHQQIKPAYGLQPKIQ